MGNNPLSADEKFWLLFWAITAIVVISAIFIPLHYITTKDVKMAEAGYVQKVIVVGNPNDTYSRRVETIWVPKDSLNSTDHLIERDK